MKILRCHWFPDRKVPQKPLSAQNFRFRPRANTSRDLPSPRTVDGIPVLASASEEMSDITQKGLRVIIYRYYKRETPIFWPQCSLRRRAEPTQIWYQRKAYDEECVMGGFRIKYSRWFMRYKHLKVIDVTWQPLL